MKIGIIGSGVVGQTLGTKLAEQGQSVVLGTRNPEALDEKRGLGEPLRDWLARVDGKGGVATFPEAASYGELIINATAGTVSIEALEQAEARNLGDKILIDVANPLDFSRGMPPTLTVCNTDSLGEQIQRAFPDARVVKTLNTVNAQVMVAPDRVAEGDHAIFVCGNDAAAKAAVTRYLVEWFGWKEDSIIDLGGIDGARGTEMILPLWLRLWGALDTPMFNFKIAR